MRRCGVWLAVGATRWYTDEGSLLANYGVEGVSFDYVDGKPVLNETVTDAPEGMRDALLIYASNDTICCVIDPTAVTSGYSDVDKAAPEIWNEGMDDTMVIPSTVTLSADENTRAANIYSDVLQTVCLEAIAKFITGEKPLTEYDSFVESIPECWASKTIWPFSRALMTVLWRTDPTEKSPAFPE